MWVEEHVMCALYALMNMAIVALGMLLMLAVVGRLLLALMWMLADKTVLPT